MLSLMHLRTKEKGCFNYAGHRQIASSRDLSFSRNRCKKVSSQAALWFELLLVRIFSSPAPFLQIVSVLVSGIHSYFFYEDAQLLTSVSTQSFANTHKDADLQSPLRHAAASSTDPGIVEETPRRPYFKIFSASAIHRVLTVKVF